MRKKTELENRVRKCRGMSPEHTIPPSPLLSSHHDSIPCSRHQRALYLTSRGAALLSNLSIHLSGTPPSPNSNLNCALRCLRRRRRRRCCCCCCRLRWAGGRACVVAACPRSRRARARGRSRRCGRAPHQGARRRTRRVAS